MSFSLILIALAAVLGLFAIVVVYLIWLRGFDEFVAELPHEVGPRALRTTRSSLIVCLLATYPALLAWRLAAVTLPAEFQAPWWGALLVTYAGCWLLLYAVVEHKWRIRLQTPNPSDPDGGGDATSS